MPYVYEPLKDPFLHDVDEDTENLAIFESNQPKGDDYKVVNMDDGVDVLKGVGLEYDNCQRVFKAEQVDEFSEDEIIVKLTGNAGQSVAACLDVHGSGSADVEHDDEGNPVLDENGNPQINGDPLLEYPLDDAEEYRARYYCDTELRPDFEGEKAVFLLQRRKNVPGQPDDAGGHWATVLGKTDDGWTTIEPTDEFEPERLTKFATGWFEWNYPDEAELERLRDEQGIEIDSRVIFGY